MRVVHCCLSCFYIDNFSYQENEIVLRNVLDGHEVTVIASLETYDSKNNLIYVAPNEYIGAEGARVVRVPYCSFLPFKLARKVRAYNGVKRLLESLNPEIILFHGLSAWELLTVSRFARLNPHIRLFVDCHQDFNNSARSWISRNLLHKLFYKRIFQNSLEAIEEVLAVTVESQDFATEFYGSPKSKTRIFPLGVSIEDDEKLFWRRQKFRAEHSIEANDLVIVQTGKLNASKKLRDALLAFIKIKSEDLKFVIAGRMSDDVRDECHELLVSDRRILNLGWQSSDNLRNALAGSDLYIQPFGQTVTTQMAMGSGCVVIVENLPSHRWLIGDKGYLFNGSAELPETLFMAVENRSRIPALRTLTLDFARRELDYQMLARKLFN